jgi:thiamine-monophosphate kinase
MSISLPAAIDEAWVAAFAKGLGEDATHYGCALLGGDTDHTPGPLSISMTAFGSVPHGAMVRRATAKSGDSIVVTGTIGDAALGVLLRRNESLAKRWQLTDAMNVHLKERYLLPQPRNALAEAVRNAASAAMDVSDGLAGDLTKLCRVSQVAAEIDVAKVPLSDAAKATITADPAMLETALTGGDDYEIVCTIPPAKADSFRSAAKAANVAVTEIGTIAAGDGARFFKDGAPLSFKRASFSHF